jgi:protocatechuate 3,4-dioxygenase beta subunit
MQRFLPFGWITRGTRALLAACVPTADATRGPVYRSGAPWRSRLCGLDEPGEPLTITGQVTASPACRPIANATLDVWQTNTRGWYSNLLGLENASDRGAFNLRGRIRSDHDGRYHFESIVPGRYPFPWPLTRPRHIHLIVTHAQHESLTTQIYFEGDQYNDSDPWWHESLTIRLAEEIDAQSGRVGRRGVFDIAMEQKSG